MTKKENASGAFLPLVLLFRNDLLISPQVFGEGPDFSTAPLCRGIVYLTEVAEGAKTGRIANADAPAVDITPEMIAAGALVLTRRWADLMAITGPELFREVSAEILVESLLSRK
jgi:hypothetical protein